MPQAQARRVNTCIVPDGQSLCILPAGNAQVGHQLAARLHNCTCGDGALVAVGATAWSSLALSQTARSNPYANCAPLTIMVMIGGTNDVLDGTAAASIYALMKNYAVAAKAAGYDKIIATTITPYTGFTVGQNTQRTAANDLVIGNADSAFDRVCDLACDSTLSSPGHAPSGTTVYGSGNLSDPNSPYYADHLHWSGIGAIDAAITLQVAAVALGA